MLNFNFIYKKNILNCKINIHEYVKNITNLPKLF